MVAGTQAAVPVQGLRSLMWSFSQASVFGAACPSTDGPDKLLCHGGWYGIIEPGLCSFTSVVGLTVMSPLLIMPGDLLVIPPGVYHGESPILNPKFPSSLTPVPADIESMDGECTLSCALRDKRVSHS